MKRQRLENFFVTPTTINNLSLNSQRSSEDSSLDENSVRQGCMDSIQMDQASSMGASNVTDPNEIPSLYLQIPTDIGTKDTDPAQPILSSYPKAIFDNKQSKI